MDDPMRGVDIGTKLEVYELIREPRRGAAAHSSGTRPKRKSCDNCDRVYVFRNGRIVAELDRDEMTEEKVIQSSFAMRTMADAAASQAHRVACADSHGAGAAPSAARRCCRRCRWSLILIAIAWLNPRAISYFGFNLMLNLAIPIALATIAQMFVITVNDLDLSIGTFVGFVGCVTATWLREAPLLGVADAARRRSASMPALGALIHLRNLPSIVVTLGMSFVWQGLAILLLPKPGGKAPDWLLSSSWASSRPSCRFRSWPRSSSPPSPMSA